MDAEGPEILDIGHPRRDSGWRQRLRIHAFSPPGCLVVLDSRIEPDRNRRGHKGWIVGDDVDGDDEQAALLAGGVDFGYESDEPTMLVVNGRPRKPLPQDGIVRNAAVDVQGDQPMRVTCPASGKQSARRLLAFSQARRLRLGVGESGRHTRAGTLARGCQAGRSLRRGFPTLVGSCSDLKQDQVTGRMSPRDDAVDPGVRRRDGRRPDLQHWLCTKACRPTGVVLDAGQVAVEHMPAAQHPRLADNPSAATLTATVGARRPHLH